MRISHNALGNRLCSLNISRDLKGLKEHFLVEPLKSCTTLGYQLYFLWPISLTSPFFAVYLKWGWSNKGSADWRSLQNFSNFKSLPVLGRQTWQWLGIVVYLKMMSYSDMSLQESCTIHIVIKTMNILIDKISSLHPKLFNEVLSLVSLEDIKILLGVSCSSSNRDRFPWVLFALRWLTQYEPLPFSILNVLTAKRQSRVLVPHSHSS